MKLRFRAAAVRDLDGIFDYSLAMHGPDVATAYIHDLNAVMERLLEYPETGVLLDLRPGLRSVAAREHRVYYKTERDYIVVARVLHKAMDAGRRLS